MTNIDANGWVLIIGAISFGLCQVATVVLGYKANSKMARVETATDGMKTALVKATGEAERAKGEMVGRAKEKARK